MERVSSIFSQIVKLVPRRLFDEAVARHQGDRHAKGMTCWSQFVAMLFAPVGRGPLAARNHHRPAGQ